MIEVNTEFGGRLEKQHSIIAGALTNSFDLVAQALSEDANCINCQDDKMGVTALHIAAGNGNFEMVDFLCGQAGLNPFVNDFSGRSALYMAQGIGDVDSAARIMQLVYDHAKAWLGDDDGPQDKVVQFKPGPKP